ncbi:SDR family oxidoreductase, partial [Thalassotalea sp. G20_0]|uniref:UDP-glucose 4-epimerase family protein n=1 Tax=Thalassotalea sp. G20_0 TaxID=2821093 RepID=UPI001AD9D9FB
INDTTNWSVALRGIDIIIHLAARAHIMGDEAADPLSEYRLVNVAGTLNLARQAAAAGVKRFIFVSSIKVNGETTSGLQPFTESLTCEVHDPYGMSKKEAEDGLRIIAAETGMEVVIIRPPLVYGAGVKANFLNLMKLADTPIPLPFGAINNKRSMVYVGNLVDFIIQCIDHPSAANQTFLVCDGEDLSLRSLLDMIRASLGRPPRLVPIPAFLFQIAGSIAGKREVVDRLVGNLQIDSSKARNLLNWVPTFTVQQGIDSTIASYLKCKE